MKKYFYGLTVAMISLFLAPAGAQEDQPGPQEGLSESQESQQSQPGPQEGLSGSQEDQPGSQENLSPGEEASSEAMRLVGETPPPKASMWRDKRSGNLYASSTVQFALAARDNLSKVDYIEYRINGNQYIRYSSPITLPSEGAHSIYYRAIDRAGNREFDRSFNVIIDNSQPEVSIYPTQSFVEKDGRIYSSQGNTFTFRAIDKYSGVKAITYAVNGDAQQIYQAGRTIQLTESGRQLIRYKAEDNLGNATEEESLLINVDDSRPVVRIQPTQPLITVNGENYSRRTTGFNILATDQGSGVESILVRIDGSQEWQTYADTIYFASDEVHTIKAKAIDAVGNESEPVSLGFTVDENPPMSEVKTSISIDPAAAGAASPETPASPADQ